MRIFLKQMSLAFMLCVLGGLLPAQAQQRSEAPLTNASIIKLVRAGFKEKTVIALVRTRPAQFDLSPEQLIILKRNGVSENIILHMVARDEAAFVNAEDFDDDPFFNNKNGQAGSRKQNQQNDNSTDIFGSNSGSSDRTQSRGAGQSGSGSTETTGNATVRIIRPPPDAGGAPKLEKTPTLTNDSIIELVEAGFSEGTIIRRIENAPVEFDLSPSKLAELRKRRVSDPVINAMTAAMSDDPGKE
jgi:hypothetical protein